MKAKTTRRKKALWLVSLLPCLIGLLSAAQPAFADFSAKVMEIVGGDTIILWHNNRTEKIRLNGVVCPDKTQPYGGQAKRFTSFMIQNKDVTVRVVGKDQNGSTIGDVILRDGQELNKELVKEGLAWWDRKQSTNQNLGQLENVARAEKRGLWADPHPVPPWEWKKQRPEPLVNPCAGGGGLRLPSERRHPYDRTDPQAHRH